VGAVWQITACDAASSFGVAWTCAALGIRHTPSSRATRGRTAWSNGCSRASLDRSLHGFMQFYNFERPHHGYRVRGRTPATVFHGAVAAAR